MKKITRVICVMAFCLVAMMGMSNVSYAATVGTQLATNESGWQRIDDANSNIIYRGTWGKTNGSQYNSYRWNQNCTNCAGGSVSTISIKFYGTKLRIIGEMSDNKVKDAIVSIDNVNSTFSEYSTTGIFKALVYEKTGLELGVHTVIIKTPSTMTSSQYFVLDAIDIDDSGYLINPYSLKANAGNKKVDLSWNDNSIEGATKYIIKRSTTAGGPYIQIGTSTTNSFADTDVVNGTTYYYVICADGSTDSKEVSATPNGDYEGNSAILEIAMTNGTIKEYSLTNTELESFLTWYDNRSDGTGKSYYRIPKKSNVKPFLSRKEYLSFDKIYSFEVKNYNE
ncbi:MAG: hypothetical protein ACERKN_13715 [Velocimicrobium sp.]